MGRKYDFFDFQKLLLKEDVNLEEFLKNQFDVGDEVLRALETLGIDRKKKTSDLSQREMDKLYRFYESGFSRIEEEKDRKPERVEEKPKIRKKWYERFYRWFWSSDGFLVLMGKNERHNKTILRRYSGENDLLLFTDEQNPIFTVIRNKSSLPIPPETIYEAAEFCASYSKAWKEKAEKTTVFYVKKDQVSLNDRIVVKGEIRSIEKVKPVISISVKKENEILKLICGPPRAVRKISGFLVTLNPGDRGAEELSKEIKKELMVKAPFELKDLIEGISLREIERLIPFGMGEIVR